MCGSGRVPSESAPYRIEDRALASRAQPASPQGARLRRAVRAVACSRGRLPHPLGAPRGSSALGLWLSRGASGRGSRCNGSAHGGNCGRGQAELGATPGNGGCHIPRTRRSTNGRRTSLGGQATSRLHRVHSADPAPICGWQQGGNKTRRDEPRRACRGRAEVALTNQEPRDHTRRPETAGGCF